MTQADEVCAGNERPEFASEGYGEDKDTPLVFNRAMQWVRPPGGNIICYCTGGDLQLTGENQVSRWVSDPANLIEHTDKWVTFAKRSAGCHDWLALPAFQFNLLQHPRVELTVAEASDDWQLCVLVKGRSGPPLVFSPWQRDAATLTFDLAAELNKRGLALHFPELHFLLGTWNADPAAESRLKFSLRLLGQAALVPCLPVIRTAHTAAESGIPIAAVVLDENGQRLDQTQAAVHAEVQGNKVSFEETDGVWTAGLRDLVEGDYEVGLVAEGAVSRQASLQVRVTDGRFHRYDSDLKLITRGGKVRGPLTGSYHGTFLVRNSGRPDEELVMGQAAWEAYTHAQPPHLSSHQWWGLTTAELDNNFSYLAECGWDLLHLAVNWATWERLDVAGNIAPHGAEQVALVMRTAARHGLALLEALSHYPYDSPGAEVFEYATYPYQQYLDWGYRAEMWQDVSSEFTAVHFINSFLFLLIQN